MSTLKQHAPNLGRDIFISLFIYALPIVVLYSYAVEHPNLLSGKAELPSFLVPLKPFFEDFRQKGYIIMLFALGALEALAGLYDRKWNKNERFVDIACFIAPQILIYPLLGLFSIKALPYLLPSAAGIFSWVPFWGGFLLIAIADDLTQYWYHRLHHQVPFLWRFHRTHHSAPYMGMAMANRQNVIYTLFFSQIYLTATFIYLGLGLPALFVQGLKSIIVLGAHSSLKWDKPFYKYKVLHPIAWILERFISTPATHHAHHANTTDDGVGYYKGNFGNMFFLWDIIFGTGIISRQYPSGYGTKAYKEEEWYAQLFWPIFKSQKVGSELSANGPETAE
jgi:sterol desaturase/sphingolipid hydroxylase (fatty acid hydroxylase superfamily)